MCCSKPCGEKTSYGWKKIFERRPSALNPLDGLRAIAILWVYLDHLALFMPNSVNFTNCLSSQFWSVLLLKLMKAGSLAVDVFFVLSGFLISYLILRDYNKTGFVDAWGFYRGRFLRLWPTMLPWALTWTVAFSGMGFYISVGYLSSLTFTNNFMGY